MACNPTRNGIFLAHEKRHFLADEYGRTERMMARAPYLTRREVAKSKLNASSAAIRCASQKISPSNWQIWVIRYRRDPSGMSAFANSGHTDRPKQG